MESSCLSDRPGFLPNGIATHSLGLVIDLADVAMYTHSLHDNQHTMSEFGEREMPYEASKRAPRCGSGSSLSTESRL